MWWIEEEILFTQCYSQPELISEETSDKTKLRGILQKKISYILQKCQYPEGKRKAEKLFQIKGI